MPSRRGATIRDGRGTVNVLARSVNPVSHSFASGEMSMIFAPEDRNSVLVAKRRHTVDAEQLTSAQRLAFGVSASCLRTLGRFQAGRNGRFSAGWPNGIGHWVIGESACHF